MFVITDTDVSELDITDWPRLLEALVCVTARANAADRWLLALQHQPLTKFPSTWKNISKYLEIYFQVLGNFASACRKLSGIMMC